MEVERAIQSEAQALARLIYLSGVDNILGVFTGHQSALSRAQREAISLSYLQSALNYQHGQFGYHNHYVIRDTQKVIACVSFWVHPMPEQFKKATLASLLSHFNALDSAIILKHSQLLTKLVTPPTQNELSIGHLAVDPDYRRQGCANALLSFCQQQARILGKQSLILDLSANNTCAMQCYLKFGFQKVHEKHPDDRAASLGLHTHIHMCKAL